jgi:hypothetical protein
MSLGSIAPYDINPQQYYEGLILYADRILTVPNVSGKTARVATVTPGVADTNATTYRLYEALTRQTITFVSAATPTAAQVVTGLTAAIRANSVLNGLVTVSGTTTLILTNRVMGSAKSAQLVFSDGGSTPTNVLTVAQTATGTEAGDLMFGRAMTYSNSSSNPALITAALSSTNVFAGVTGFTLFDLEDDPNTAYAAVNLVRKGEVVVYSDTAVDPTLPVFASFGSGVSRGRFRATTDANASQVQVGLLSWGARTTTPGLVPLRINMA